VSKHYVVWKGRKPGIYSSWDECKSQVEGIVGALYKAFPTRAAAEAAYKGRPWDYFKKSNEPVKPSPELLKKLGDCYAVDAACSGNPGVLEYQCVHVPTGRAIFKQGPFPEGTNNIGEFLALVEALAMFKEKGITVPLYTDSETAMAWLKAKRHKSKLAPSRRNAELFKRLAWAEDWLAKHGYENRVLKWETETWGENPADFGRK
jgi:ribonuclease HI